MSKQIVSSVIIFLVVLTSCASPATKKFNFGNNHQNSSKNASTLLQMDSLLVLFKLEKGVIKIENILKKQYKNAMKIYLDEKYTTNLRVLKKYLPDKIATSPTPLYDGIELTENHGYSIVHSGKGSIFREKVISVGGAITDIILLPLSIPLAILDKETRERGIMENSTESKINQTEVNRFGQYLNSLLVEEILEAQKNREKLKTFIERYPEANLTANKFVTKKMLNFARGAYTTTPKNDPKALANFISDFSYDWYSDECYKPLSSWANIRKRPDASSKRVTKIRKKDQICSLNERSGWLKVETHNHYEGWIKKSVLRKIKRPFEDRNIQELKVILKNARNLKSKVEKAQKIAIKKGKIRNFRKQKTANSLYAAFKLSNNHDDIEKSLLYITNLDQLNKLIKKNTELQNDPLVMDKYAFLYRNKNTFDDYVRAFQLSRSYDDIDKAAKILNIATSKQFFDKDLLDVFIDRYVISTYRIYSFLDMLDKINNVDKNHFHKKLIASQYFGGSLSIDNFFASRAYKRVLHLYIPSVSVSGEGNKIFLYLKYPGKKIYFSFMGNCKYSRTNSSEGYGILTLFGAGATHINYYTVKSCNIFEKDSNTIKKFARKLTGRSSLRIPSWEVSKFSHKGPLTTSSSNSSTTNPVDYIKQQDWKAPRGSDQAYTVGCKNGSYGTATETDVGSHMGSYCASGGRNNVAKCKPKNMWSLQKAAKIVCD